MGKKKKLFGFDTFLPPFLIGFIMQFITHKQAGEAIIILQGEAYYHLFRSRRTQKLDSLKLCNLKDNNLYTYQITNITKKEATLKLQYATQAPLNPPKSHLIWAMIEPKCIEKTLPALNELNLAKITFFYADFSQKNFKLDFSRIERILEKSSQQCGRTNLLEIEFLEDLQSVCEKYPHLAVLDFGYNALPPNLEVPILVGCEGGFSQKERELLKDFKTFSTTNTHILRSENAAVYAICKIN